MDLRKDLDASAFRVCDCTDDGKYDNAITIASMIPAEAIGDDG